MMGREGVSDNRIGAAGLGGPVEQTRFLPGDPW